MNNEEVKNEGSGTGSETPAGPLTPTQGADTSETTSTKNPDPTTPVGDLPPDSGEDVSEAPQVKTPQELNRERIELEKKLAEGIDEEGLSDETVLRALARRKYMTAERRGAIESFVERLKEIR